LLGNDADHTGQHAGSEFDELIHGWFLCGSEFSIRSVDQLARSAWISRSR
jgi:hypothetical protein